MSWMKPQMTFCKFYFCTKQPQWSFFRRFHIPPQNFCATSASYSRDSQQGNTEAVNGDGWRANITPRCHRNRHTPQCSKSAPGLSCRLLEERAMMETNSHSGRRIYFAVCCTEMPWNKITERPEERVSVSKSTIDLLSDKTAVVNEGLAGSPPYRSPRRATHTPN